MVRQPGSRLRLPARLFLSDPARELKKADSSPSVTPPEPEEVVVRVWLGGDGGDDGDVRQVEV